MKEKKKKKKKKKEKGKQKILNEISIHENIPYDIKDSIEDKSKGLNIILE